MIILGLGSNQGDRLANLRNALELIKIIPDLIVKQASPVYISDALLPENAPTDWDLPYLNCALRCETQLNPYDLLFHVKHLETRLGRKPDKDWGPRIIDIDILAWDNLIQYDQKLHIPHENLHERPFALWPLADVAPFWVYPLKGPYQGKTAVEIAAQWGSRFNGKAPFQTQQIQQRIDTSQLVGILNITPDSFSDGGKFLNPNLALKQMQKLVEAGAEIIDLGAESTGPNATPINADEEWERLEPILTALPHFKIKPKISIDTRHAKTAKKALALNVDWINDVSGAIQTDMQEILAEHSCDIVIMHHLGIPVNKHHTLPILTHPTKLVYAWVEKQLDHLEKLSIKRDRIIIDTGIGYGKTAEQSLELIKHISVFQELGVRLLVGHSRKSFLQLFTHEPPNERDIETLTLSLYLNKQKVNYLRVHDIESHAKSFKVHALIYSN